MTTKISVLCATFNGLELLKETFSPLLENLSKTPFSNELILIDNGSSDGTDVFLDGISKPFLRFRFPNNLGFAKAYNFAAKKASGEYLFFINNDVLVKEDFLSPLVDLAEKNPGVFAVGPKFLKWDGSSLDDGIRQPVFERGLVDCILKTENLDQVQPMVFFCGAGFLVQKQKFFNLGLFDEIFSPFSWEDLDLGYRAVKRGYFHLFCPKVILLHKREATSRKIFSDISFKSKVWKNKFIFMWSNFSDPDLLLAHLIQIPVKLIKFLLTGRWPYVIGFMKALFSLPYVFKKRHREKSLITRKDRWIFDHSWKKGIKIAL